MFKGRKEKKKKLYSNQQYCYKCYQETKKLKRLYKFNDGTNALFCDVHGYNGECTNCKAMDFEGIKED